MLRILVFIFLCLPGLATAALAVKVRVEGVAGELEENVLKYLTIEAEHDHPMLERRRLQSLHQRADEEIRKALRPFGYYHPQIDGSLQEQDGHWLARYVIDAGEPVRVSELSLQIDGEAAADASFMRWQKDFPLQVGDVLLHTEYEAAKRELMDLTRDRGYFEAVLEKQALEITLADKSVRVVLHLQSGPRYQFGEIRFDDVGLNGDLLRSYLTFAEGDYYDADRLFNLQRELANSDYFEVIDLHSGVDAASNGRVPVDVRLRLRKPGRYTLGLGYGTDTGPRVGLGMELRRINKAGHRVNVDTMVSQKQNSILATYRIPLHRHPNSDFISFSAGWENEKLDHQKHDTVTVGAGLTMLLGRWQRTYAMTYQRETYRLAGVEDTTTLVLPSISLQRIEAEDRMFPESGWLLGFELRGASTTLGSDVSLLQGVVRGKYITPLFGGRLLTRADYGVSKTPEFERVPASLRFFAGGDYSVRGYGYKRLGPVNEQGEVVGGRNLFTTSVEYDRYFNSLFGAAVFYDAGNAFNGTHFRFRQAAGAGMRVRLPFGALRVDVAAPINDRSHNWRLHITLGPDL